MRFIFVCALVALLCSSSIAASSDEKKEKKAKPCTIHSPSSDRFFDLNPIHVPSPDSSNKKHDKDGKPITTSWQAKGYDYPANFTMNFCGPVIEQLDNVVDLKAADWGNVSAYYNKSGNIYSIGQQSSEPIFRGRKLVLEYTGGSYCSSGLSSRSAPSHVSDDFWASEKHKKDDDNDTAMAQPNGTDKRRKSSIISLLCEDNTMAGLDEASVAFVGASPDDCTYFFEARSRAACGGIEKAAQQVSPGGVFLIIALIAVMVYVLGGCVYQRTVMHQRGWRQLPNYSMWAGIAGFFSDMFIIATSSCSRCFPSRRGYSRVSMNGNGSRRGRDSDDENRLIDQLDEEWED
ncbi:mannose 6-phosphate receptor domain-containing protein [Saccharata proteae CBS 121410]|uniref:Mannose 6-phosphate receptor domain-containing protein n=1 Tax=Saccharata proteae CBS 121410 TaxID=1314787 RepID=A0A9P4M364_9PEZI|nr:mannose 6-phosphate receptor domain-containing protein [Saccharata proteae CBS 121410]